MHILICTVNLFWSRIHDFHDVTYIQLCCCSWLRTDTNLLSDEGKLFHKGRSVQCQAEVTLLAKGVCDKVPKVSATWGFGIRTVS